MTDLRIARVKKGDLIALSREEAEAVKLMLEQLQEVVSNEHPFWTKTDNEGIERVRAGLAALLAQKEM